MSIIDEINSIADNRSKKLEEKDAYIIRSNGLKGVAIVVPDEMKFHEEFHHLILETKTINIGGEHNKILFLYTSDKFFSKNCELICMDFLSISQREILKTNPYVWFNSWAELLGNSKKNKMVYDVLGEMKVLSLLLKRGEKVKWESMQKATYDIAGDKAFYEVKSTKRKETEIVSINSQYQLDYASLSKPLYLAYCKVEESINGESIDSIYNELLEQGYPKDELDKYLLSINYYEGKEDRKKNFIIHEIKLYLVDDSFPKLTPASFVNNELPKGVITIKYAISLDGLESVKLI